MKTKDKNEFVIIVFCYIKNKKYKHQQIFLQEIEHSNPQLYAENDEDIYYFITFEELAVIERLKLKYENKRKT